MKTPNPGLKPMAPGLRTVHYDAQSAGKVDLIVQPGDVLIVSGDVADQLAASSSQFKDVTPEDGQPQTASEAAPLPPAKSAGRKRHAEPKE